MTWRDIHREQNFELAQKMLDQQGEINRLVAEVRNVTGERDVARGERDRALAAIERARQTLDRLLLKPGAVTPDMVWQLRNDLGLTEQDGAVKGVQPCAEHSSRTVYYCCQPADGRTER